VNSTKADPSTLAKSISDDLQRECVFNGVIFCLALAAVFLFKEYGSSDPFLLPGLIFFNTIGIRRCQRICRAIMVFDHPESNPHEATEVTSL
jgi:hypothetical protein